MNFSILIPTLNEEKYLGKLLDCLVEQSFKDFEVIVNDGFSEDKTKEVAGGYSDKLDIKVFNSPRRGVAFQRNYAASKAKYDRFMFFDADVVIKKDFLKKVAEYLEENDADVLTCKNVPLSGKIIDKISYFVYFDIYLWLYRNSKPGAVGTFIYCNKDIFNKVGGFSEEVTLGEDMDLVDRMYEEGAQYVLLKDPVVYASVRRMDEEGRASIIWKNIRAYFHYHFKGPIKDPKKFKHTMGEHD